MKKQILLWFLFAFGALAVSGQTIMEEAVRLDKERIAIEAELIETAKLEAAFAAERQPIDAKAESLAAEQRAFEIRRDTYIADSKRFNAAVAKFESESCTPDPKNLAKCAAYIAEGTRLELWSNRLDKEVTALEKLGPDIVARTNMVRLELDRFSNKGIDVTAKRSFVKVSIHDLIEDLTQLVERAKKDERLADRIADPCKEFDDLPKAKICIKAIIGPTEK